VRLQGLLAMLLPPLLLLPLLLLMVQRLLLLMVQVPGLPLVPSMLLWQCLLRRPMARHLLLQRLQGHWPWHPLLVRLRKTVR